MQKSLISLCVAILFAASIICCCSVKAALAQELSSAKACHQCGSKTSKTNTSSHECCLMKAAAAEQAPMYIFASGTVKTIVPFIDLVLHSLRSVQHKYNLAYLDGPPGFVRSVPLYLQSHCLRI